MHADRWSALAWAASSARRLYAGKPAVKRCASKSCGPVRAVETRGRDRAERAEAARRARDAAARGPRPARLGGPADRRGVGRGTRPPRPRRRSRCTSRSSAARWGPGQPIATRPGGYALERKQGGPRPGAVRDARGAGAPGSRSTEAARLLREALGLLPRTAAGGRAAARPGRARAGPARGYAAHRRWRSAWRPTCASAATAPSCAELEALAAEHPYRERLHAQLDARALPVGTGRPKRSRRCPARAQVAGRRARARTGSRAASPRGGDPAPGHGPRARARRRRGRGPRPAAGAARCRRPRCSGARTTWRRPRACSPTTTCACSP